MLAEAKTCASAPPTISSFNSPEAPYFAFTSMPEAAVKARAVSSSASRRLPAACSSTGSACTGVDISATTAKERTRSVRTKNSRARLRCIGEEQLLPVDLVIGDRLLAFRRDQPVDERLAEILLHVRVLRRIHLDHAVLVEQPPVALDRDQQRAAVLERDPRAAVGQHI